METEATKLHLINFPALSQPTMGAKCSEMAMGTPSKVDAQQAFEEDQEEGEARPFF